MGLSLAKKLMSPQKMFALSAKFTILISWSPVCTPFNPLSLSLKWVTTFWLQQNRNIQKHGDWAVLQNYLHDEGKGVREETIYFYFWIEYCSAQFIPDRSSCHGN